MVVSRFDSCPAYTKMRSVMGSTEEEELITSFSRAGSNPVASSMMQGRTNGLNVCVLTIFCIRGARSVSFMTSQESVHPAWIPNMVQAGELLGVISLIVPK